MKSRLQLLFFLVIISHLSFGQTIHDLFLALPDQYTPQLNKSRKDSLLRFNTYTFPGGDSIETKTCTYSSETDDHLVVEYSYTTGQQEFKIVQLRKLIKSDGTPCIIYARYDGHDRSFFQHGLFVFSYSNNSLIKDPTIILPETITVKEFFKAGTPEAIIREHEQIISTSYDLKPTGFDAIEYLAYPRLETEYDLLETEVIRYTWDGKGFKRSIVER
ncbi:MAG TPA: hypothetical protein VGK59_14485 [Ohtaekwangia sp.]